MAAPPIPRTPPPARRGKKPAAPPKGRTRLLVDERRAQLLELGIRAFSERSYDEVSIDDLARAAGISKGLLFHYFPTKRDFYVATIRAAARALLAATFPEKIDDPLVRLRTALDAYFDYVEAHAAPYAALIRGGIGSDPEVASVVEETRAEYIERLREGLPSSLASTPILRAALRGWLGFVEAVALEWIDRRDVSRDALRELLSQMLVACTTAAASA